jgi:SAM-dependent methyltransferase
MANEPPAAGTTPTGTHKASDYAMGSSDRERRRLMRQGAIFREPLTAAFRAAGIGPGMRVLDLGSGAGDVALLAAELVGPTGSVVGLDRDAASVAWATKRVAEAGIANVRFQTVEFNVFTDPQPFDALIGRFILMYLPDPVATIRHLSTQLRSGAVIAFMEPDFTVPSRAIPEVPDFVHFGEWICETLRRAGARVDMGMRLHHTYRDAGFAGTATAVFHTSGCGLQHDMAEFFAETTRSLLPKMVEFGIATLEEVQIDTLAERMETAGRAADPQWVGARVISAWARKP